jgi:hypothetical protein
MTTLRFNVMGWLAAFMGSLAVAVMWGLVTIMVVGGNAGNLFEGLALINMSNSLVAALPGGQLFAALLENPTYRAYTASAVAWTLALLECLAVHAGFRLIRKLLGIGEKSWRERIRQEVELAVLCAAFAIVLVTALWFEIAMWADRAHSDVALAAATGAKAAWMGMENGNGEKVVDSAHTLARLGSAAFFLLTAGLAFALEFVGYLIIHTGKALAVSIDKLKSATIADVWLDTVLPVIGGAKGEEASRRTALANSARYFVHRSGRIYSQAFKARLERFGKRAGRIACLVAFLLIVDHTVASAADVASFDPPRVFVADVLDLSGTTARTRAERVGLLRAQLKDLESRVESDVRATPAPRFVIWIATVDAFGGETVWRSSARELGQLTDSWWKQTLESRRSYAGCSKFSDLWVKIGAFINEARSCDTVSVTLLTDLIVEEPFGEDAKHCRPKMFGPSPEVPWEALKRATVRGYYVDDHVKMMWEPALRAHGLSESFAMFAGPDPSGKLPVPTPAEVCTQSGAEANRTVRTATRIVGVLFVLVVLCAVVPFLVARS